MQSHGQHELAVGSIRFVMTEYPPSGRGQGHLTHLYIFGSRSGLGADKARHFELGLQIELRILPLHMLKFCSMGCIQGHVNVKKFSGLSQSWKEAGYCGQSHKIDVK